MKRFKRLLGIRLKENSRIRRTITRTGGKIHGQTSLNIMAALNAMVAATNGVYLEIGVLQSKSMCGAMVGNVARTFVGVDDCALAPAGMAERNVRKFFPDADFRFYPTGFREFFKEHASEWRGRVSAYFYDADHSLQGQRDGLWLALESGILADEAFIAVDDYSWTDSKQAVKEFLAACPEWKIALEEEDDWNQRGWWNGLVVLYRPFKLTEGRRKKGESEMPQDERLSRYGRLRRGRRRGIRRA